MAKHINILPKDLKGFVAAMQKRAEDIGDANREATEKAVKHVHEKIPSYPAASGQPYPFKSLRQQLFVIISFAEGTLKPYRRTGQLGGSITDEVRPLGGNSYVGVIGTNKVYAPWVISTKPVGERGPQASYHKGIWYTLQEVVEACQDAINKIYHNTIMNKINSH